jgi:type I restriction enzyme, S subunit
MSNETTLKIDVPSGWVIACIPELISREGLFVDGDWIESKDQDSNGGVRLIQLADIGDGDFKNKSARFLTLKRANEINCTFLKEGDILVARMPHPIGRSCIFPLKGENKFVTAVDVAIIRTGINGVNNKLLNYFINSPLIRNKIELLQSGTTRKRISRSNLSTLSFLIPPLLEQYRIVARLDELLSELEKGKEQLRTSLEQLKVYRQSILKQAFDGDLKINGSNYKLKRIKRGRRKIGDLLDFIGSGATPRGGQNVYVEKGVLFIRSQNVYPNELWLENIVHITDEFDEKMKRSRVKEFDVLLNITGASIGRCAFVPQNFPKSNVNQHVCILRPKKELLNYRYLTFYLNSFQAQNDIMNAQSGATRQGLNYTQIKNLDIPFCDIIEQGLIVAELEKLHSSINSSENEINNQLNKADLLKRSLLQKSFEGRLVPQDPNEEPANVMLERIKEERQKYLEGETEKKQTEKSHIVKIQKMAEELKTILELLKESKDPVAAKTLWQSSVFKYNIDAFYAELKKHIDNGEVKEIPRRGKESFLTLSLIK